MSKLWATLWTERIKLEKHKIKAMKVYFNSQKSKIYNILFFVSLFFICFYFDFFIILKSDFQSQHVWRQTDSASQALNYYQRNMNFFQPEVHNLIDGDSHTLAEFPITYYLSAILMQFFGPQNWTIRIVNLAFFLIGVFYFFKLNLKICDNFLLALFSSLCLFCCPVVVFYASSSVPNSAALGMIFVAGWFFYCFQDTQKINFLWKSMLLFSIAGMIKPTLLVTYFALLGVWMYDVLHKKQEDRAVFKQPISQLIPLSLVIFCLLIWRIYVYWYVTKHHSETFFLSHVMPIWDMNSDDITATWRWMKNFWVKISFGRLLMQLFLGVFIATIFYFRRFPKWLYAFWLLTLLGSIGIACLFFQQFSIHDYYAIDFYPLFAVALMALAAVFSILKNNVTKNLIIIFLGFILFQNILHSKADLSDRYNYVKPYDHEKNSSFFKQKELQLFLDSLHIDKKDFIVSIPDFSPNTNLYFLNRKGLTNYNFVYIKLEAEKISDVLQRNNCKYLIVSNINSQIVKPFAYLMTDDKLRGVFDNSIYVYQLF